MQKNITYTTIALGLSIIGYFLYDHFSVSNNTTTVNNTVITISSGSIRNTVKATGKVYPVQESNLTFTKQGTIAAIYKKVGDTIKAGELIAELDAKSAKLDVASARLAVSNAENNLNKVLGGSTETEKIKLTSTISDAQARLKQLQKDADNLVMEQKYAIENAVTNIKTIEEKLALAKNDLLYTQNNPSSPTTSTLALETTKGFGLVQSIYDELYDDIELINTTLGLENTYNPVTWAIGGNNPDLKAQINTLYTSIKQNREDLVSTFPNIKNNSSSIPDVLEGLNLMKKIVGDTNTLTAMGIASLRASIIGSNINQSLVDNKISILTGLATSLNTKINNIVSATTSINNYSNTSLVDLATSNAISTKKLNVTNTQNDLNKAKQDLSQTQASYESRILSSNQAIESQKNTIKLATATYNDTINGTSTDIISAKNSIKSAQIGLEKSILTLKDYQIYANFDGIIRDIPWVVGDTITSSSSSTPESISITNSGGYEIQVSLDQADIVKIQPGMQARISLDAYANASFSGTVSSVSPTPIESSNVVSYTAKILMPSIDKEIYSNMSATVTITISEVTDVIVIPSRAVKSIKGKTYVTNVATNSPNGSTTAIEVTLGITDGNTVEVLSGLHIGDMIIVSNNNTRMGSGATNRPPATPSIFGGIGGGGGGNNRGAAPF